MWLQGTKFNYMLTEFGSKIRFPGFSCRSPFEEISSLLEGADGASVVKWCLHLVPKVLMVLKFGSKINFPIF